MKIIEKRWFQIILGVLMTLGLAAVTVGLIFMEPWTVGSGAIAFLAPIFATLIARAIVEQTRKGLASGKKQANVVYEEAVVQSSKIRTMTNGVPSAYDVMVTIINRNPNTGKNPTVEAISYKKVERDEEVRVASYKTLLVILT